MIKLGHKRKGHCDRISTMFGLAEGKRKEDKGRYFHCLVSRMERKFKSNDGDTNCFTKKKKLQTVDVIRCGKWLLVNEKMILVMGLNEN